MRSEVLNISIKVTFDTNLPRTFIRIQDLTDANISTECDTQCTILSSTMIEREIIASVGNIIEKRLGKK